MNIRSRLKTTNKKVSLEDKTQKLTDFAIDHILKEPVYESPDSFLVEDALIIGEFIGYKLIDGAHAEELNGRFVVCHDAVPRNVFHEFG